MEQTKLLEILKANQALETQEEIDLFLEAVYQLDPNDGALLPDILYLYHDGVIVDGPYKELDRVVAMMDTSLVAVNLVKVTPELISKAKDYLDLYYILVVTDPQARDVLIDALRESSDENRRIIIGLLDELFLSSDSNDDSDLEVQDGIRIVKSNV
jgi:hypothetical protein